MKNRFFKLSTTFLLLILLLFSTIYPCSAYDPSRGLGSIKEYLPDELKDKLPESLSKKADALDENTRDGTYEILSELSVSNFLGFLAEILLLSIRPVLSAFSMLVGVLVICAAMSSLKNSMLSESMTAAVEYISALCIALTVYVLISEQWESTYKLLDGMNVLMHSMLPMITVLYTAGGNVTAAAVNNAGMITVMTLMESITHKLLYPLLQICFAFSFMSGVVTAVNLKGISEFIRNTFTTILGFLMAILSLFLLTYQNKLAVSADGIAARTVKFAASTMVPVVGSALGEATRTLGGSISFIKSTVGVLGIAAIAYMILPSVVTIILYRGAFGFAVIIAKALGCDKEGDFIASVQGILGFSLSVLCACAMFFIFSMTLFLKSGTALSA